MVLHQVGWCYCPYIFHLGTILQLSLLAALVPPEWPDLLRLATSAFRFLISPWGLLMAVCISMISASSVERRLAYSATCSVRVLFAVVRLVTAARYSAVACARLVNAMDISVALFAVPVWYPP